VPAGGNYQALATMPNGDADWVGAVLALKAAAPDAGVDAGSIPDPLPGQYIVSCGCESTPMPSAALASMAILLGMVRLREAAARRA
jgi:hypothetical protein